jgi:hypothetical protein
MEIRIYYCGYNGVTGNGRTTNRVNNKSIEKLAITHLTHLLFPTKAGTSQKTKELKFCNYNG